MLVSDVNIQQNVKQNRTAGRGAAHRGGVGAAGDCRRAEGCENFRAYSPQTADVSRGHPDTAVGPTPLHNPRAASAHVKARTGSTLSNILRDAAGFAEKEVGRCSQQVEGHANRWP